MASVHCSFCGHLTHLPENWVGKDLKCLACNRVFRARADAAPAHETPAAVERSGDAWGRLSRRFADLFTPGGA